MISTVCYSILEVLMLRSVVFLKEFVSRERPEGIVIVSNCEDSHRTVASVRNMFVNYSKLFVYVMKTGSSVCSTGGASDVRLVRVSGNQPRQSSFA